MNTVEKVFLGTVKREGLLPKGARVTAAVSGGADSMAMLHLLHRFGPARGWEIQVLHVDHGIRPDSGADADFVRESCSCMGIPCRIESPAGPGEGSLESRWSLVRNRLYKESGTIVSVAHTMSDRAETLLMRLMEGSGLRGLGGMDYRGRGRVVRPLLDITRLQVRTFLSDNGMAWREDPTNLDAAQARNRIRRYVMPVLEKQFPEAVDGLARSSALLSQWRDLQDLVAEGAGEGISLRQYSENPDALRLTLLWAMAGRPRSGAAELRKTDAWLLSGGKGEHVLPGGLVLVADGETLRTREREDRFR